jgi:HxlR-like helix-turn-helix
MTTTIADAFDLVGKRWALQVVRELALGPQRYTDLRRRLAGISTNVLAAASVSSNRPRSLAGDSCPRRQVRRSTN